MASTTLLEPFEQWGPQHITDAILELQAGGQTEESLAYYRGDHWQNGAGWAGPFPDSTTTPAADFTTWVQMLARIFTSHNVVREVVERHVNACLGRTIPLTVLAPEQEVTDATENINPADGQHGLIDKAKAVKKQLDAWADRRQVLGEAKKAVGSLKTTGRMLVRLFIPPGRLKATADGKAKDVPKGLPADKVFDLLYFESVEPDQGGIWTNRETMGRAAFFTWKDGAGHDRYELQYLDENSKTVIKTWDNGTESVPVVFDFGGNLLMFGLTAEAMITESIKQNQRQLNFQLTAMGKNSETAGFLERIISNAQPPGAYVDDPSAPGGKRFKPDAYQAGPTSTVWLQGVPALDEDGKTTGYSNPSVLFRDPVPVQTFIDAAETYRKNILFETKQGHIAKTGDGSASGTSRIHLRADYTTSLFETKPLVDGMYQWIFDTLAKVVAVIAGDDLLAGFQLKCDSRPDSGPLSDAEITEVMNRWFKGLMSTETTLLMLGIDDPLAEIERVRAELPNRPVSIEQLALLAIELQPEAAAAILTRCGLPVDLVALKAAALAKSEAASALNDARARGANPLPTGGGTGPGGAPGE